MKKYRAFTLVELMIVIVIIGIIIGVMIFHYFTAIDAAKTAKAKEEISTLCQAIGKYKSRHGKWPDKLAELEYKGYLAKIPADPWEGNYGIDLCFGVVGNFDTARPRAEGGLGTQLLAMKRFKPKQYFFTNNKNDRLIDKYDILGRKMKAIKLKASGVNQNFSFGSFDVDEMDNIYVADLGLHELRIFDKNGEEYVDESVELGSEEIMDVEVGKSILTGRPMKIRNEIQKPTARLATHFYTLAGSNKVRLYNVYSKKLMSELDGTENDRDHGYTQVADIVISGELYILSKNDSEISVYDQNAIQRRRVVELESTGGNRGLVVLSNNYFVVLEASKNVTLYRFDSSYEGGCYKIGDSYKSELANPDKIAFDAGGFIYVKSGKDIEILRFDEKNEIIDMYLGPMVKEQPIEYNSNLYDIRFAGLK